MNQNFNTEIRFYIILKILKEYLYLLKTMPTRNDNNIISRRDKKLLK